MTGLSSPDIVVDPVWGVRLASAELTEMEPEPALNAEELRMNREAKTYHPVYNNMAFPDSLDAPARTVTATCTRVSRESIVIASPDAPGTYRRLTIRERASLQGFPITYQFYARSFAEKAKMVGNAIPPTFTYLLACAAQGQELRAFKSFADAGASLSLPPTKAPFTAPNAEGRTYPEGRSFRAAIPGLRFKSGMRFELANVYTQAGVAWRVRFFFGPSRDIREVELDVDLLRQLEQSAFVRSARASLARRFLEMHQRLRESDPEMLQKAWSRRGEGTGPFEVADLLGELAARLLAELERAPRDVRAAAVGYVLAAAAEGEVGETIPGSRKLAHNALAILAGLVVGSWFNTLDWHGREKVEAA